MFRIFIVIYLGSGMLAPSIYANIFGRHMYTFFHIETPKRPRNALCHCARSHLIYHCPSILSWWQDVDNALVTRPMPFSMAMAMVFEEHLLIYEVASESDGCEAETGE